MGKRGDASISRENDQMKSGNGMGIGAGTFLLLWNGQMEEKNEMLRRAAMAKGIKEMRGLQCRAWANGILAAANHMHGLLCLC